MNANMKAMAGTAYNPVTMLNPNTIAEDVRRGYRVPEKPLHRCPRYRE